MPTDDTTTTDAPVNRRAQAKVERRLALIEATIDCIAEHGLSGTTMARVTDLAGTSIGLANFYFENKERLFEAVLQHLADAERAVWQEMIALPAQGPAERLIALIDARFDARTCNPRTLAVWFAFWGDAGARAIYRRIVEATDDAHLSILVGLIREIDAGDENRTRNADKIALGLEASFDGLWLNMLLYPQAFPRLDCRQRAVEQFMALFPALFEGLPTAAPRVFGAARDKELPHGA